MFWLELFYELYYDFFGRYFDGAFGNIYNNATFIFISFIIFCILNLILQIIMHILYDNDMNENLDNYYVDIKDIDIDDLKPELMGIIRNSRKPNGRELGVVLFSLINKKAVKLETDTLNDVLYIQKSPKIRNIKLSKAEETLLDMMEDRKYGLKYFFCDFCSGYPAKKISKILEEESENFFDKTRRNKIFDYIFYFQKICIAIFTFILLISGVFSFPIESDQNEQMLNTGFSILYMAPFLLTIFVSLNISKFFFDIIKRTSSILSEKEHLSKFFQKTAIQLILLCVIFVFSKTIGAYLILLYMLAYAVMLSQNKEFINIKKIYLKKKIEIKTLEKYIKEHSLLENREVEQIRLYEMYYTYAFALGITVASDEYLKIEKILKKDGARIEKNHILDYIAAIVNL